MNHHRIRMNTVGSLSRQQGQEEHSSSAIRTLLEGEPILRLIYNIKVWIKEVLKVQK